ncbi:hypothetical protein I552_7815 [Mycobacterium xenopi 3993]|nr:hypothetical protein I552_7815 [Mycobacterium xenopi 3993]
MEIVGHTHGVQPQPEHLGVLGLLERELRQVHFVAEPPFRAHRGHERLDVLGDRLFARDELRAQPGGVVALALSKRLPIVAVTGEVDISGSQNFALPPTNSLSGKLSQFSPPAASEPYRVRVI